MPNKHTVAPENAPKFLDWIAHRGGIAIWGSIDLSDLGRSWSTPTTHEDGTPATKPTWQAGNKPTIITDPAEVEVVEPREVKRFHVAIRVGSQGLKLKCTDASTRRIRAAVAKAGPDAWYEFDYDTQEAVILVPGSKVPLAEWKPIPADSK